MKDKIVFILNSIDGGGIDRVVTTFANEIAGQGVYDVVLVLLHKKNHFFSIHPDIQIIENNARRKHLFKMSYTVKTAFFIRRTIRLLRPLRIISNGEWLNSFVYLSLTGIKSALYFADHSNPERGGQSPFPMADRLIYPKVDGVLVLSVAAQRKIKDQMGQKKVYLVDNPVSFPVLKPLYKENIIMCMGRLSAEKGQDILIKAFARLDSSWRLHLLGDGPKRNELESLADELGLKHRVLFLGLQQDIASHLCKAKIYVMPSHTENFPMALLEAMSMGLACVGTNCMPWRGDNDFIKDGENGIKVPVADPEAMAAGIERIINDEYLMEGLGKKALEIRDRYQLDQIVDGFKTALNIN